MQILDWLCERDDGLAHLADGEREAAISFALLWMYFEARLLNTRASSTALKTLVSRLEQAKLALDGEPIAVFTTIFDGGLPRDLRCTKKTEFRAPQPSLLPWAARKTCTGIWSDGDQYGHRTAQGACTALARIPRKTSGSTQTRAGARSCRGAARTSTLARSQRFPGARCCSSSR